MLGKALILLCLAAGIQHLAAQPTATKCPCDQTQDRYCLGYRDATGAQKLYPLPARCPGNPQCADPSVDCSGCKNFQPTAPYTHIQGWCRAQKKRAYADLDAEWKAAGDNENTRNIPSSGFPMYGCTLGCVFGRSLNTFAVSAPYLDGSWSGKCFNYFDANGLPNFMDNIVSPLGSLLNWNRTGLPGIRTISAQMGWSAKSVLDGKPVWIVEYTNVQVYVQLGFKRLFDECRWTEHKPNNVGTGQYYLLCRAFFELKNGDAQANTGRIVEWVLFGFMQTCSKSANGQYAVKPGDRTML